MMNALLKSEALKSALTLPVLLLTAMLVLAGCDGGGDAESGEESSEGTTSN